MITLTKSQNTAVESILDWARSTQSKQWFVLGGYAGTGKSTIIYEIVSKFQDEGIPVAIATPTGKAAHVLQVKGVPATTIHQFCYKLQGEDKDSHDPIFEFAGISRADKLVLIVDEASMVSRTIHTDIAGTGVKILYVGDPAQLPPVEDDPLLVDNPDFLLTEIMRQAEKNPILRFAHALREGASKPDFESFHTPPNLHFITMADFNPDKVDIVISGKNATRRSINSALRDMKDDDDDTEDVVMIKNNFKYGLMNGMTGKLKVTARDGLERPTTGILSYLDTDYGLNEIYPNNFGATAYEFPYKDEFVYMDYGYALTCHKSQGSEWTSVAVADEPIGGSKRDMRRWRYTAATRATTNLYWIDMG